MTSMYLYFYDLVCILKDIFLFLKSMITIIYNCDVLSNQRSLKEPKSLLKSWWWDVFFCLCNFFFQMKFLNLSIYLAAIVNGNFLLNRNWQFIFLFLFLTSLPLNNMLMMTWLTCWIFCFVIGCKLCEQTLDLLKKK